MTGGIRCKRRRTRCEADIQTKGVEEEVEKAGEGEEGAEAAPGKY